LHSSVCNLPPNVFLECWKKGLIEQFDDENKEENHVQTQNPIPSSIGQYELEVQFLAKFSDSAFFGG
jgi:hypothetical protein